MKKYTLLMVLATTGVFYYSCSNDSLDVVPLESITDVTFWKTEADAKMGLVGCYQIFAAGNNWRGTLELDGGSDNASDCRGYSALASGQMTATSSYFNFFAYDRIQRYNNFLLKVQDVPMDESTKNIFAAEVRFLRAWDYMLKTMFFGDVPLVTTVLGPNERLPRDPVATVQQFVLDELEAISNILPVMNNAESGGHVTSGSALALKARLELYMERYVDAMVDAKRVIDMNVYELDPDYTTMFYPGNQSSVEAIFTMNFAKNFIGEEFIPREFLINSYNGYSCMACSKSLLDTYEMANGKTIDDPTSGYDPDRPFENRDARMRQTMLFPGSNYWDGQIFNSLDFFLPDGTKNINHWSVGASSGLASIKYVKPVSIVDNQQYDVAIMIIRLAEMYLIYAEAAVEADQNKDLGLQYLNLVRQRVDQPDATELTRDLVRRERRVEFALEGLRYFDIRRWDIGASTLGVPLLGVKEGTVDMSTGEVTWFANDLVIDANRVFLPERNYLLPIPQSEIDISGMAQNPGY
ncbi:MAG: RagB/SusD family nutrient uptake outer membrane protein [Cyclobacteriaceae bacterium]